MPELPTDILYNIFSRIPFKSLGRFQCVCKLWCKYINDPYLTNIHVNKAIPIIYQEFSAAYSNKRCVVSFLTINQSTTPIEAKKDSIWEFSLKEKSCLSRENVVLGSCNGLLLVYASEDHEHGIVSLLVINPLRKECHELPPMRIWSSQTSFGFGFDDSTNTFKIVCVFVNCAKIYTIIHVLGTDSWREIPQASCYDTKTGSWRNIPQAPCYDMNGEAVFAHGCLYWFASDCVDLWSSEEGEKIVWFDLKTEKFGRIDLPKQYGYQLVDLNGELGLVYKNIDISLEVSKDIDFPFKNKSIEVWILKDKEWVMKCRFDQNPSLFDGNTIVSGGWNEDGDILMTSCQERCRFIVYNMKSGVLHEAKVVGQEVTDEWADVGMYHQSSLISINAIITNAYSIKNQSI